MLIDFHIRIVMQTLNAGEKTMEKIKGILDIEGKNESEIFEKAIGELASNRDIKIGVQASIDWELDKITMSIEDKDGQHIGTMTFQCEEFRKLMDKSLNIEEKKFPKEEDLTKEEQEKIQKDCDEDVKEMTDNPVSKEIEKYHEEEEEEKVDFKRYTKKTLMEWCEKNRYLDQEEEKEDFDRLWADVKDKAVILELNLDEEKGQGELVIRIHIGVGD